MIAGTVRVRIRDEILIAISFLIMLVGWIVCLRPSVAPTAYERSLNELLSATRNRRSNANDLGKLHVAAFPNDDLGIACAAEAAVGAGDHLLAIDLYQRLPPDGGKWEFHSQMGLARRYEKFGQVGAAEIALRRALEINPYDLEANSRLGYLCQIEGRSWEGSRLAFMQIQQGKCRGDELLGVAAPERFFLFDERLEAIGTQVVPPEVLLKLPAARRALFENRSAEAETLLREIAAIHPELGEVQGRLGRIIVDRGDSEEFLHWVANLPAAARQHPETWFAQGLQARRLGQIEGAVNCFLETLTLSPNHLSANMQIANCLERLGNQDAARAFAQRGELLADLEATLNQVRASSAPQMMSKAVQLLGSSGRYWEAAGWCHVMTHLDIPQDVPRQQMRRWLRLALAGKGINELSGLPARLLKRSEFAVPVWPGPGTNNSNRPRVESMPVEASKAGWSFVDDAERVGIRFQYYEGTTEENRMQHIFNTMGGGLGALDYDLDGWPDLYLAQANNWREPASQPEHADRLFRNDDGERFLEATWQAGLGDLSFSHGVTVGDFDQDGFPDVYLGNKGPNRLYHNNGDGTFLDVTPAAHVAGNEWTTSSVFADFNGDGLPDLYVLNYSLLKETAEKECRSPDGEPMACSPDRLIAETDRCYQNLGDGRFQDVSKVAGVLLPEGKGLGVIVWDFGGEGRLGIFVANDTSPNFLLMNEGLNANGIPHFQDEALVRGVGVDGDGNAQASMGVAASDANADGRIDLFITTFFGESKTLFSQREGGFFEDLSRPFNLRDSGFWMLGFGCQFADLDGDGWEDLIATNGHVDQKAVNGDPDRMRPQVFHNQRGQRFDEVPHSALGKFFQRRYLGRGLATLDWNRDGRTDVGISHLHSPFALLTNHTQPQGRPVVVHLIGRAGCREPTGAVIRVRGTPETRASDDARAALHDKKSVQEKNPGLEQIRLQTAGDGFLVTNERRHQFSVAREHSSVTVEVRWPGGKIEEWPGVPVGREILLIEDRKTPVILKQFP